MMRLLLLVALAGCSLDSSVDDMAVYGSAEPMQDVGYNPSSPPPAPERSAAPEPAVVGQLLGTTGAGTGAGGMFGGAVDAVALDGLAEPASPELKSESSGDAAALRQWFPESFLWQPLVETGADGTADVPVAVPDQLTTWRVLALAHDRAGSQAGSVYTFDSSLPAYVDLAVPGWLYVGDQVDLPVHVVARDGGLQADLLAEGRGSVSGSGGGAVHLDQPGSLVRTLRLEATAPGDGVVRAALGEVDALERVIPVVPTGRPEPRDVAGVLSTERQLQLIAPAGADVRSQELWLEVYPGPLAMLGDEVERLAGGASGGSLGYGLALSGAATTLAERTGTELDAAALRRLRILGWQRVVRVARSPSPDVAVELLVALEGAEGEDVEAMRWRMQRVLEESQRADGTWSRSDRGTLQAVLVQTAATARALPEDARGPRLRAAGALERFASDVSDSYTASVVVASGLVDGDTAERLRQVVRDALAEDPTLPVDSGVVGLAGQPPTVTERQAWAWLALAGEEQALDLLSELMLRYDAARGFGAGSADVLVLEVLERGLPSVDAPVQVELLHHDAVVSTASVDPAQPHVSAVFAVPTDGDADAWSLRVSPGVAGLAYRGELRSWVPWGRVADAPLEVSVPPLRVGQLADVSVGALRAHTADVLEIPLPAGCMVESHWTSAGTVRVLSDRVLVERPASSSLEPTEVTLSVRPAYAGRFTTAPLAITRGASQELLPPPTWRVSPRP